MRATSVRVRLGLAFGALILLLAAMAGVGTWRLAELDQRTAEMATVNLRVERVVGEWLAQTRTNLLRRLVVTRSADPTLGRLLAPEMAAASTKINELQGEVEKLVDSREAQVLLKEAAQKRSAFLKARQAVADKKQGGDDEGANALLESAMVPAQNVYLASLEALRDHFTREVERDAQAAAQSARSGRQLLLGFCLAGMLLGLLASWQIARSITRPIDEALDAARKVAEGDLTLKLSVRGRDEMAQLLRALEDMAARLRLLVGEVAQGARSVAETSAQIAQGNADLSQRTEEQASTLEETASSMEELTSTVGQNAENARVARELAARATEIARGGGAAVEQVVATMNGISASSRKIADIIGVIDSIAFQTNILALNAAVEAARAGDQGRGFAVVAGEVRTLAHRSAEAAKQVKVLIGESAQEVEAGSAHVAVAGRQMGDIVQSVARVNELITEIASASQEQSSGIGQVNTAITQMDQVVQQNASLVEEAAAATEAMKSESEVLLQLVGRFRVGEDASAQRVAPAVVPAVALPASARAEPAREPARLAAAGAEWQEF